MARRSVPPNSAVSRPFSHVTDPPAEGTSTARSPTGRSSCRREVLSRGMEMSNSPLPCAGCGLGPPFVVARGFSPRFSDVLSESCRRCGPVCSTRTTIDWPSALHVGSTVRPSSMQAEATIETSCFFNGMCTSAAGSKSQSSKTACRASIESRSGWPCLIRVP